MLQFYMTFEVCVSQFFLAGIRSSLPQTWESYIDFTLDRRRSFGLEDAFEPHFQIHVLPHISHFLLQSHQIFPPTHQNQGHHRGAAPHSSGQEVVASHKNYGSGVKN